MPETIEQELKQVRPIRSLHEQAVLGLMRTSRAIEESWLSYLKRTEGISISQYNILRILRGALPHAIKSSEIADRMIYGDPDVTRLWTVSVNRILSLERRTPPIDEWC